MNYYMLCWSNEGFEAIVDVTDYHPENFEAACAMAIICGEPVPENEASRIAHQLKMRAQFNPQRHYECYVIGANEDIGTEALEIWAEGDAQSLVDFAREKHFYKVFESRKTQQPSVIH